MSRDDGLSLFSYSREFYFKQAYALAPSTAQSAADGQRPGSLLLLGKSMNRFVWREMWFGDQPHMYTYISDLLLLEFSRIHSK